MFKETFKFIKLMIAHIIKVYHRHRISTRIEKRIRKEEVKQVKGIYLIVDTGTVAAVTGITDDPCAAALQYNVVEATARGFVPTTRRIIVINDELNHTNDKTLVAAISLHEFAHHYLGHLKDGSREGTIEIEFEADRYVFDHNREAAVALEAYLRKSGEKYNNITSLRRATRLTALLERE